MSKFTYKLNLQVALFGSFKMFVGLCVMCVDTITFIGRQSKESMWVEG